MPDAKTSNLLATINTLHKFLLDLGIEQALEKAWLIFEEIQNKSAITERDNRTTCGIVE